MEKFPNCNFYEKSSFCWSVKITSTYATILLLGYLTILLSNLIQWNNLLQVLDTAYDGVTLKCANQSIIADNDNGKMGYIVPLEVMPAEQFEPLYRTPLSIQVSHSNVALMV
jgi:hypothetical protein